MIESIQNRTNIRIGRAPLPAVAVRESDVLKAYSGSFCVHVRPFGRLDLQILKLKETLDRSQGFDESRDLATKVSDRPLDLADQLEKGRHHSVSDRAVPDPEYSPQKGSRIASHEPEVHKATGKSVEIKLFDRVFKETVLYLVELGDDVLDAEKSKDKNPVLHILLNGLLGLAVP